MRKAPLHPRRSIIPVNHVSSAMTSTEPKITRHVRLYGTMSKNRQKRPPEGLQGPQMLGLSDTDWKTMKLTMLKNSKKKTSLICQE